MEQQQRRSAVILAALSLAVVLILLAGVSYAWFTFDPYTRVTPMEGKISEGDTNLLISQSREGPFDKACALSPANMPGELQPVSSGDLVRFFAAARQEGERITQFRDVSGSYGEYGISGTVYLKCEGGSCNVYLQAPPLYLGAEGQWLAAGRLGLRITGADGAAATYLFRLDSLGSTAGASQQATVAMANAVVGSSGQLIADPSEDIGGYLYGTSAPKALCRLKAGEIASVAYWVYLEGCDDACCNPVQARELALQLGFTGQKSE